MCIPMNRLSIKLDKWKWKFIFHLYVIIHYKNSKLHNSIKIYFYIHCKGFQNVFTILKNVICTTLKDWPVPKNELKKKKKNWPV